MRALIACEESQVVTLALRDLGIDAYSSDILDTSGPRPEWHIKGPVEALLDYHWDMIIAFPPCTDLCSSGARWFKAKQADGRQQASIDFFMLFADHPCLKIAIENPIGIMSSKYRKPDQIIQPWQFGHGETKSTCLWLKGLPKLIPTDIVEGREARIHKLPPSPGRSKLRSKTYQGVAIAMATQWANEK